MEIIDVISGGGLASVFGGLTGVLGSWLTARQERKILEMELLDKADARAHAALMVDKELDGMRMEAEKDITLANIDSVTRMDLSADNLMKSSHTMAEGDIGDTANEGWILRSIEGARRLIRVVASYYALVGITLINLWTFSAWSIMNMVLTQAQLYKITILLIETDIYLSTTILLYWFGTRAKKSKDIVSALK